MRRILALLSTLLLWAPASAASVDTDDVELAEVEASFSVPLAHYRVPSPTWTAASTTACAAGTTPEEHVTLAVVSVPHEGLVRVAGKPAARLRHRGLLPHLELDRNGHTGIARELQQLAEGDDASLAGGCTLRPPDPDLEPSSSGRRVLLVIDARAPTETVNVVQRSARLAGFALVDVAVSPSAEALDPVPLTAPAPQVSASVRIHGEGLSIGLRGSDDEPVRLPCARQRCRRLADYPLDEARSHLREHGVGVVDVLANDRLPWAITAGVLAATRADRTGLIAGAPHLTTGGRLPIQPVEVRPGPAAPPLEASSSGAIDVLGLGVPQVLPQSRRRVDHVGPPGATPRHAADATAPQSFEAAPRIILGALDRTLIDQVIKADIPRIRYCYQRELSKDPSLQGKLVIKFVISQDGSVSSARVRTDELGNDRVSDCVIGRFRELVFPEPKGGGIVIVSYPFSFTSG